MNENLNVGLTFPPSNPISPKQFGFNKTKDVFDNFLQAQKDGDENALDILQPLQLRYFAPAELLRILCFHGQFDPIFRWPANVTARTKYRLIGNSVNVKVVTELINYLFL